jgi:beta-1,4-mannosyl-glycoprotein beta-1,4-N-acetylglucosaminyltransferase
MKQKIFDCFMFYNEVELLHLRFLEYYDVVDYFVISESTKSHTGKIRELEFEKHKEKFKKYLDKVIYVIVDDLPEYSVNDIWKAENFQRNAIQRGLENVAKKGDLILVSDCDEFWNKNKLNEIKNKKDVYVFEHELYYYWVNCKQNCIILGTASAPYGSLGPQEMRKIRDSAVSGNYPYIVKSGGWHYSYMGGANKIKDKVDNIAESHLIKKDVGDERNILNSLDNVIDLWGRKDNYARKRLINLKPENKPSALDEFLEIYPDFYRKPYRKNVEVVSLIYASVDYLNLITDELLKIQNEDIGWDVGSRIVANDANKRVLDALVGVNSPYFPKINYTIYNDKNPNDYYLNRVYRAYNYAVETSEYDNVVLVNSDMVFAKDWLKNLLKHHNGKNIPVSRLIESGKMQSGKYGVSMYFGNNPKNIKYTKWYEYSQKVIQKNKDIIKEGGLYMPVVFDKETFIKTGGYPEGNVYEDGSIGTRNGAVKKSGDAYYYEDILEKKFGMRHITVFDSLCYHIQEGERDEELNKTLITKVTEKYEMPKLKKFFINVFCGFIPSKKLRKKIRGKVLIKKDKIVFQAETISEVDIIANQAKIIRSILEGCNYKSYLELGIYDGSTFNYVSKGVNLANCVDLVKTDKVNPKQFFNLTTDGFFKNNKNTFDLIFIDACHDFEYVKKDFENSVKILNKLGTIILHDTDPESEKYLDKGYCSDSYKMNDYLIKMNKYHIVTIPLDECGLTIVRRKNDLRHKEFIK